VPGEYTITFALAGFDSRSLGSVLLRAGETLRLDQQMSVASLKETVEVVAPFLPPPAPAKPLPPPPVPTRIPSSRKFSLRSAGRAIQPTSHLRSGTLPGAATICAAA